MRLDLGDAIGNALIELIEYDGADRVLLSQVIAYGQKVCVILNKETDERCVFYPQRGDMERILAEGLLNSFDSSDGLTVCLLNGLTVDDLRRRYRSFLSLSMMLVMTDDEARKCLNIPGGV